jgi:hypothetical protein
MNKGNKNATHRANDNRRPQEREFNLDRKHTVGQFLRVHPDALRVMKQGQRDQRGAFSIEQRARLV